MAPRLITPLLESFDSVVTLPGSKSISNRALLVAGLAEGTSILHGLLDAQDTRAMAGAVEAFGAVVDTDWESDVTRITGLGAAPISGPLRLDARQSGTTGRFLLAAAATGRGEIVIDGDAQLRARPMIDLLDALAALGVSSESLDRPAGLPQRIAATGLKGGVIELPGNVSSQFASALLLAAPLANEPISLRLTGEVVSSPYLAMTVEVMRAFGASVEVRSDREFVVATGGYCATEFLVEPDASTASYMMAAAAISASKVRIDGLTNTSVQGDVEFAEVLGRMGALIEYPNGAIEVTGPSRLVGVDVDLRDFSDTVPTLAVVAAFASSTTTIRGVGFIRGKESDRIVATVTELRRAGIAATGMADGLIIEPSNPQPAEIQTYDDHRIAMAFSVLGLRVPGIRIANPECVAKTFPDFFDSFDALSLDRDPLVVVIDGPAGAGKSTVSKAIATRLGIEVLDTGAMYRAVAHAALSRGIDMADAVALQELTAKLSIEVDGPEVRIDGVDASNVIRTAAVSQAVSVVAANPGVREVLVREQRAWMLGKGGGVAEGRDMGTVVFPNATLKIYMTAAIEERAKRRAAESADFDYASALADLERRDAVDSSREHAPLTAASNAVAIDTTALSVDAIVDEVVALLSAKTRPAEL